MGTVLSHHLWVDTDQLSALNDQHPACRSTLPMAWRNRLYSVTALYSQMHVLHCVMFAWDSAV